MKFRYILLFLFLSTLLSAESNVDSLLQAVATQKQDTNQVNNLIVITIDLRSNYPDSAQIYAERALQLAEKLGFSKGTSDAIYQLAVIQYFKGDYEKALEYIEINKQQLKKIPQPEKALLSTFILEGNIHKNIGNHAKAMEIYNNSLIIAKKIKDNHLWVLISNNKANIYRRQGRHGEALKVYLQALKICEGDELIEDKILVLGNIGLLYKEQKKYDKALQYYKETLIYRRKSDDKRGIAIALNNIGNLYSDQKKYKKALLVQEEALKIREEMNDFSGVASSLGNIGTIYYLAFGNYQKALEYTQRSLTMKLKINEKEGIADSYLTISDIYNKQGFYKKAIENAMQSLNNIEELNNIQLQQKAYQILGETHEKLGDYKMALTYFKKEQVVNDSIFSKTNRDAVNELTEKYQFEKQEQTIYTQQLKLEQQEAREKINRSIFLGVITLLAILGMFGFYTIQQKQSTNKKLKDLNTEIKGQNTELLLAQNRLKVANQDLQSFTSMASHDLKEPLRMMASFSQLLQRRNKNLDETSQEYISYITEAANRMTRMVNDMLSYATNTIVIETLEYLDLNEVINSVQKNLQFIITESKAVISVQNNLPSIKGQASLIEQVFQNLIANAIKFQRPTVTPIVTLTYEVIDENIVFKIIDNGIGIAAENQVKVFALFKRFNQEYEGSGIGLATCKKIVELHNGTIRLESTLEQGTTFILTFPA